MKNAIHTFHIDHVIPLHRGGESDVSNLALSCGGCNSAKSHHISGTDPVSSEQHPLFNPRTQLWADHFTWSDDFLEMIGLTSVGRASIAALQLNRKGVVSMRRLTWQVGEHPPG